MEHVTVFEYIQEFPRVFAATVTIGIVCPLIGTLLLLRRMTFLGVALPQFAMAGVACAVFLAPHLAHFVPILDGSPTAQRAVPDEEYVQVHEELEALVGELDVESREASREGQEGPGPDSHAAQDPHALGHDSFHTNPLYEMVFALVFTIVALLVLLLAARARSVSADAVIGSAFALASAATIFFISQSAIGRDHVEQIVRGDLVEIARSDFPLFLAVFALAALTIAALRRRILLVCYDREMARTLGIHVILWDSLILGTASLTIAIGVVCTGPIIIFGLLILPALTARMLARSMHQQFVLAVVFGLIAILAGYALSVEGRIVMGASIVLVAGAVMLAIAPLAWLRSRFRTAS